MFISVCVYFSDKLCDQISDAILDAHLKGDPEPDVVCSEYNFINEQITCWLVVFFETLVYHLIDAIARPGIVLICGEISSKANVDYQQVIRDTIEGIGYDDLQKGIVYQS